MKPNLNIKNVIFDLGGVLIDWNPDKVYKDVFNNDSEKMIHFYTKICTQDWNENQDAGYPMAKATEERVALFPEYEKEIRMFYGRWDDMLGNQIQGTVDILKELSDDPNYKVVALTNWSHETFPKAIAKFSFLQWFEGILVSGEEKTRKPFPEIYELTLSKFNLKAGESLFIDDNLRNIEAARKFGIHSIHFQSPEQLNKELGTYIKQ
ncbi:MAG: HAD family phosphatase [Flavobacteriaceae bacterium]|jgi:2-haloacid dehalogenase|nr:HAD family phosphatase [Flavobacteriaceae bacterium]MDO7581139.1 HAD family phosphatase [Flavobacteriaceae bacterium]MDO7592066.1 HAD family phosphatase [Flavobacteriaceae bacterium]MDO7599331.1 HAD family phosphatase [Flavobacteriaceae bacterium]MDO7603059.1 HAD family phosphatase [Flavobacteriaceae bacterium]